MALSRGRPRLAVADTLMGWFVDKRDIQHPVPKMKTSEKVTPGYHWLQQHYVLTPWQILWWNGIKSRFTGEVLVGKDWRNNHFFVKIDPRAHLGHRRFARFAESWELPQDYDADFLWKNWLEYRVGPPPTPQQCARQHKYEESKYDLQELVLQRAQQLEVTDPKHERVRRYQEYMDQKWDIRRSKEITNNALGQTWLIQRNANPDLQDKMMYSRWQALWEWYNFKVVDLLRPPKKQSLWRLEDDARALKYIERIENPDYRMSPFETTRAERYQRTPSFVAGKAVPKSVTELVPTVDMKKLPKKPLGDLLTTLSDERPIWGFRNDTEYAEWFADQRKQLISARSELEQMKRDGYRPAELGGDLDPYESARPQESYEARKARQITLISKARQERLALETKKQAAARKLFGLDKQVADFKNSQTTDFKEVAVRVKEYGKIKEGDAKKYLSSRKRTRGEADDRLLKAQTFAIDDDDTVSAPDSNVVKSVFGSSGAQLFTAALSKDSPRTRPDAERPALPQAKPEQPPPPPKADAKQTPPSE
ncbi:hypothetical protein DIPPA_30170 [Diplonema papillatum]|nr:hypothetical protein DIPPA_30170 [Diplonema papillatum]